MNLSDRDMLMDLLLDTKFISTGYHHAVLESATDRVRNVLTQIHSDELASHQIVFDLMKNRGYYQVEPASGGRSAWQQAGMQGMAANLAMGTTMGTAMNMGPAPGGGMGTMGPALGGGMGTGPTWMGQQSLNPYTMGQSMPPIQPGQQ